MVKQSYLLGALIVLSLMLNSCGGTQPYATGINSQTQRVDAKLKRSDYTIMDQQYQGVVVNKKKYKKYNVDQLKETAFLEAEKSAIKAGADGVLNPTYMVDQKGKRFYVTARVKAYKLKNDNEYLDMENNLKHNPNR
ncbi:hypothetical protein [Myroides fluvii]|uniref:hypothetical protein n=1 Tax=Myroides fluvii TaxID=2572594 RepID=UPI00131B6F8E|nr:hypothetical protein [Myroides fluvii]